MIAAGIVTYNPDINRLRKNYEQYISDVKWLYVFDNGSSNIDEIQNLFSKEQKVKIIKSEENKGISYALNRIMESAVKDGMKWVLTMDQDSICQNGILSNLTKYCRNDIAIVHPHVIEMGGTRKDYLDRKKIEYIEYCITSASLTNVNAWEQVGGFDEWMFIDIVDYEFCVKVRELGYKIIRVNDVFLYQEIGKLKEIIIGKRHIYVRNHSASRKYYFTRNLIYCRYCHPKTFDLKIVLDFLISTYMKVLLFEKDKIRKIKAMNKGIGDGVKKIRELEKKKG